MPLRRAKSSQVSVLSALIVYSVITGSPPTMAISPCCHSWMIVPVMECPCPRALFRPAARPLARSGRAGCCVPCGSRPALTATLVWIAWANGSLHHELHGREDVRARTTFLLQILVLVAMGAFIPEAGGARGAAFAGAASALFAVLAVLWLLAARNDRPEYRRASRLFIIGTGVCALALAGTAFLPAGARIPAWGVLDAAYLAGYTAVIRTSSPAQQAAMTITDALIERFGLLIIIVLGETLTGVVAGLASEPFSGLTLSVGLIAVVIGFGAW